MKFWDGLGSRDIIARLSPHFARRPLTAKAHAANRGLFITLPVW
jgi:hypothetical protein